MTKQGVEINFEGRIINCYYPAFGKNYRDSFQRVKNKARGLRIPLNVASMEQLAICLREIYCKNGNNPQLTKIKYAFDSGFPPFWTSTIAFTVVRNDKIGHPAGIFTYDFKRLNDEVPKIQELWKSVNEKGARNEKGLRTSHDRKVRFAQYGTEWYRHDHGNATHRDKSDWEINLEQNSIVRALATDIGARCLAEIAAKTKMKSLVCAVSANQFPKDRSIERDEWIAHIRRNSSMLNIGWYYNSLFPDNLALPVWETTETKDCLI
jgi:hypothetical protein